ncbi:sporulation-delaying protein SdpB family protein [Bacillus cereus]|uniref:sporulation-delaying protein SdpB family protein n=1 Tax=Bacillus cereus TaxID=1396 RepID=UPI00366D279A
MFVERLGKQLTNWASNTIPWTNVYGVARSLMALATLLTLLLNDTSVFFKTQDKQLDFSHTFSIFLLSPHFKHIELIKWLCIFILFLVVIGWRPRVTALFHWWIAYSFQNSALTLDGGDQVAAVFTFLLLPIALTDSRKWHWSSYNDTRKYEIYYRLMALLTINIIRIQVAMLYFNSVAAKLREDDWINGTAVYYYLNDYMLGLPEPLLKLSGFVLNSELVVLPTWGTLIVQTILVCGLFAPKKSWKYILLVGILMHEVFAIMLGLISFSMTVCGILTLYLVPVEKNINFKYCNCFKMLYNEVVQKTRRNKKNELHD